MPSTRARSLRSSPTDAERKLWILLRRRQIDGHRVRRQRPIGPYIVDFTCLAARLVIEVDGGQHDWQAERDARRTRWLEARGYRVIRSWNNEVLSNLDGVYEVISRELEKSKQPPP